MKQINSAEIGATPTPTLAQSIAALNWGGSTVYPSYAAKMEGEGAPVVTAPAAPAASAAPAAPSTAAATTASPADGSTPAGSPTATNANDENIRQLRTNYEALKPWEKLASTIKDPTVAATAYQRHQTMFTEGQKLAHQLGYTPESFKAAFDDDPIDTISTLRQEANKANPQLAEQQRIEKAAQEAAKRALQPFTEQQNKERTDAAIKAVDTEIDRLVADEKDGFGPDTPQEIKDAVHDVMDMLLTDEALLEAKMSGKYGGVQKAFVEAKTQLIKVVNAYNKMLVDQATKKAKNANPGLRTNRPQNGGDGQPKPEGAPKTLKEFNLDDIINNVDQLPGLAAGKY